MSETLRPNCGTDQAGGALRGQPALFAQHHPPHAGRDRPGRSAEPEANKAVRDFKLESKGFNEEPENG